MQSSNAHARFSAFGKSRDKRNDSERFSLSICLSLSSPFHFRNLFVQLYFDESTAMEIPKRLDGTSDFPIDGNYTIPCN